MHPAKPLAWVVWGPILWLPVLPLLAFHAPVWSIAAAALFGAGSVIRAVAMVTVGLVPEVRTFTDPDRKPPGHDAPLSQQAKAG
jgi:hypothetical protein